MKQPDLRHFLSFGAMVIFLVMALACDELTENTYRHDISYKDYGNCKWFAAERQHSVPISIQVQLSYDDEGPVDMYVNISQTRIYEVEGQEVPIHGQSRRVYSKTHYFSAVTDLYHLPSPALTWGNNCDEIHVQVRINDPKYHILRKSRIQNCCYEFMNFSIRPKKLEEL